MRRGAPDQIGNAVLETAPRPVALALGGTAALAAAMGIGRFVYTPILPLMVADLGLSQAAAGLIASANFAGYLAGAMLAALPLRGRQRRWLIGALAVSALTTGAMGLAGGIMTFVALRFAGGLASAFALVFSSALVLERLEAMHRPELSALHFAGVGVGIAGSAVLVSGLTAVGSGWRELWVASALVSLAALAAVAALVPNLADRKPPPHRQGSSGSGRALAALIAAYGLFGFGYVITTTFLVALVRTTPAMRPVEPVVWLLVGLAAAPSVAVWTWAGRAAGPYRAFAIACVVEALGVAASVAVGASLGAIIAAVLVGGTFVGITALGLAAAQRLATGDPRRVLAVMTAAFGLGQIVGPTVAGVVYDATGSFTTPTLAAAAALLAAAVLALGAPRALDR